MPSNADIRASIVKAQAQLDANDPFTKEQCQWLVRVLELQQNLIESSERYIEELQVDGFKKDMKIHEITQAPLERPHEL